MKEIVWFEIILEEQATVEYFESNNKQIYSEEDEELFKNFDF